ncbi:MAG TPA: hypothetical protein VIL76_10005 [Phenylobacterium sp.]
MGSKLSFEDEQEDGMRIMSLCAAAAMTFALAACDKSPQAADGATATGDPGNAAATGTGAVADTGRDNAATTGADVGGAGQVAEPGGATSAGGATSPKNDEH